MSNDMRDDDFREAFGWSRRSWALTIFFFLAIVCLGGFVVRAWTLAGDKAMGLAEENVKTSNFEHSEAYRQGTRRDFDNLLLEYGRSTSPEQKAGVLSVMRTRAGDCPPDQVPPAVRDLLRGGR